jgi:nucleoside-diphosphate-sugar epimerase
MDEQFWSGKRVAVTGAGGFIGSHLVEQLVASGACVRAFVRYNSRGDQGQLAQLPATTRDAIEVVSGELRDPGAVFALLRGCHSVFHLAALIGIPYSYVNPNDVVERPTCWAA